MDGNIKLLMEQPQPNENQAGSKKTQDTVQYYGYQHKSTLNEAISETILRDLKNIGFKLKYVLMPKMREEKGRELRNWDLWGPLLLCLMLALTLSVDSNQAETVFGTVFVLIWFGAFVVTLNAKLLKGKISFLQTVCVLGYCIFPINIAALLNTSLKALLPFFVKLIIASGAFAWSTMSSIGFMATLVSEEKKNLAVYPVFLFYLFLSWFSLEG